MLPCRDGGASGHTTLLAKGGETLGSNRVEGFEKGDLRSAPDDFLR